MYAKLFSSIYQGTLRGNTHGLVVFTNMLAHADKEGWVDIHPRAIAEEVGLTLEQVNSAISDLEAPDPESRSPEESGRRIVRLDEHRAWGWRVVNYAKYRAIRSEEDRREQNRLAQQRFRDSRKPKVSESKQSKPQSAHTEVDTEVDTEAKKASGASAPGGKPPMKPDEIIFGYGLPLLTNAGTPERQARSFLGGLRKAHGDAALIDKIRDCLRLKPLQPLEWLAAALPPAGIKGHSKQTQLESRNAAVVAGWVPPELRMEAGV